MTRAKQIRDWLAENASKKNPKRMPEISAALGLTPAKLHASMGDLLRAGFVEGRGAYRLRGYWRTDKVADERKAPLGLTDEERRSRNRDRLRERRRKAGGISHEVRAARRIEKAATHQAEKEKRAEARKVAREQAKAAHREATRERNACPLVREQRAADKARRRLTSLAKSAEAKPVAPIPGTLNAAPKRKPALTSDDFLRMGGKIERIAPGVVSEAGRLKRIGGGGFRAIFAESMKHRSAAA